MWDLNLFEFFTTLIPEALAITFLYFILTGIKLEKKFYLYTSLALSIVVYFVRLLGVSYGIHTIISLFLAIFIAIKWGKISIFPALKYGVIVFVIMFAVEQISMPFLAGVLKLDFDQLDTLLKNDAVFRAWTGLVPLCLYLIVGFIVYYFKSRVKKPKENKDVPVWKNI